MNLTIDHILAGISAGGQYALIAIGYTMVYGILRLINFAHGDVFMASGLIIVYLTTAMPLQYAIPVVILAVAAALILSARLVGKVAMSNVTDSLRQIKTIFSKGHGFPYEAGDDVLRVEAIGNRVFVLSEDGSLVLDSKAGELFKYQLSNAKSKVTTFNGRALIYSNGSQNVIMQSKTEELGSI